MNLKENHFKLTCSIDKTISSHPQKIIFFDKVQILLVTNKYNISVNVFNAVSICV